MGAPKKDFDWEQFDKLCAFPDIILQTEIADLMKVSLDTCARHVRETHNVTFAEYRQQKQAGFRKRLLEAQMSSAFKGNVTMQIWLGKNYLQQREPKAEISMEVRDDDKLAREYADQLKALGFQKIQEAQIAKEDDAKPGNPG